MSKSFFFCDGTAVVLSSHKRVEDLDHIIWVVSLLAMFGTTSSGCLVCAWLGAQIVRLWWMRSFCFLHSEIRDRFYGMVVSLQFCGAVWLEMNNRILGMGRDVGRRCGVFGQI